MKITIELDLKNPEHLKIAQEVLGLEVVDFKKRKSKKEPKAELPKAEPNEDTVSQIVTIDMLRDKLAEVVMDHKDVCVKQLKTLGASSVSTLEPDRYNEFYEFLKSL